MDFLKLQIGETHILHILVLPDSSYRRVLIIKKFLMNDFSIVMVWTPHHSEVSGSISCHHGWKVWAPHTYNTYTATKAPLPPSPPWLHGPWIPASPQSTASTASPVSICHCLMRTWPSFTCPVQASHITAGASSSWLREGPSFPPPLPSGSCPAAVGLQDVRQHYPPSPRWRSFLVSSCRAGVETPLGPRLSSFAPCHKVQFFLLLMTMARICDGSRVPGTSPPRWRALECFQPLMVIVSDTALSMHIWESVGTLHYDLWISTYQPGAAAINTETCNTVYWIRLQEKQWGAAAEVMSHEWRLEMAYKSVPFTLQKDK